MFEIAPELIAVNIPGEISFSQLQRAQRCTFSGLSHNNLKLSDTPPTQRLGRPQLVGLLLHSILESISKAQGHYTREDFEQVFKRSLEGMALRSIFKPNEIGTWIEVSNMYSLLYERACTPIERRANFKTLRMIEKTFDSKDGILTGRIDLLVLKDNLPWVLTEFKSSSCYNGDEIRPDYINQLHFYGELIKEVFGEYPSILQLVAQGEKPIQITHDSGLGARVNYEARMALDLMKFRLGKDLTSTGVFVRSSGSCIRCPHTLVCPEFRKIAGAISLQGASHIAWGVCQSKPLDRERNKSIRLRVLQGSLPLEEVTILDFEAGHFPEYNGNSDDEIVITNLYYDTQNKVARMSSTSQLLQWRREAL